MNEQEDNQPLEVLAPSAVMAMEKAQIDMQIATAHQFPRSMELFKKRALSMACLDADTADSCIYVRPVGKDQSGKMKYAEGPSIRLAEIVAVSYGNLRAAVRVVEQTERYVKCTGMAHDLESNTAMQADCIESTVDKNGRPYSERQRAVVAKACASKALRDAIFKCVPRALCKPIMEKAKQVLSGKDRPLDERRKKAQAWVGSLKIEEDRVLAALGVKGWSDVTDDHLTILTGLKTAMADGDETIDSAFPPVKPAEDPHKPAATGHQQATGATGATQQAPKAASGASGTQPAPSSPPSGQTSQAPQNPPQGTGKEAETASSATAPAETAPGNVVQMPQNGGNTPKDNEDGDLGPVTQQEKAPEPAATAAPAASDPALEFGPHDTEAVKSVKLLAKQSGVTLEQVLTWAKHNKLAKDTQNHLGDLAESKLLRIQNSWNNILPAIKGEGGVTP